MSGKSIRLAKRVQQHGGLPIVLLKRHRGADRLEHLCAVPFGEFTQNLFQTRDQIFVMQETLDSRRPYYYRRLRHGRLDSGWLQTSPRHLNINQDRTKTHLQSVATFFFPEKNFIRRERAILKRCLVFVSLLI